MKLLTEPRAVEPGQRHPISLGHRSERHRTLPAISNPAGFIILLAWDEQALAESLTSHQSLVEDSVIEQIDEFDAAWAVVATFAEQLADEGVDREGLSTFRDLVARPVSQFT
jgi:hypothetical protein